MTPARRRMRCLVALVAVVVFGVVSRRSSLGWWLYDKSLGDVLYAMAAYFGLALLFPRRPPLLIAAAALLWCLAVEFLQLTELNAFLVSFPFARWLLGTTFLWHDVACYPVGAALALVTDNLVLQTRRRPTPLPG